MPRRSTPRSSALIPIVVLMHVARAVATRSVGENASPLPLLSLGASVEIFAGRSDLVERCMDRSGGNSGAFYRGKIRYRYLSRTNCDDERVWSGRFAGSPPVLGLLLCINQFPGSGVHSGLRATVRPRHSAERTCGSRRSEERFDLM